MTLEAMGLTSMDDLTGEVLLLAIHLSTVVICHQDVDQEAERLSVEMLVGGAVILAMLETHENITMSDLCDHHYERHDLPHNLMALEILEILGT
jgi:hypothetical protein